MSYPPVGRADGVVSTVEDVRAELDQLRSRLEQRRTRPPGDRIDVLPFNAATLWQVLVHRVVDLGDAAVQQLEARSAVSATVLARAAMETTALLVTLERLLAQTVGTSDTADFEPRVMQLLFGGRTPDYTTKAVNVLTQVDKVDGIYSGYRWWYDELSEICHPNYMGLLGTHGQTLWSEDAVAFGLNSDSVTIADRLTIPALRASIEIARHASSALAEGLARFTALCAAAPRTAADQT